MGNKNLFNELDAIQKKESSFIGVLASISAHPRASTERISVGVATIRTAPGMLSLSTNFDHDVTKLDSSVCAFTITALKSEVRRTSIPHPSAQTRNPFRQFIINSNLSNNRAFSRALQDRKQKIAVLRR